VTEVSSPLNSLVHLLRSKLTTFFSVTDDTDAINKAISSGNRCGPQCNSSTTTPAIVYFPAGTYLISSNIYGYYDTQIIGDATNLPVIKAAGNFANKDANLGMLDADPYIPNGWGGTYNFEQCCFVAVQH
jgi:glucan 1,3-beta-glucosidase